MKTLELEPNPLEELFLKRISKNIEDMTSNDWALLVIDFFEFCKPYMQTFQGKWADMEQPESDSRYQEFRYVGQEHWGQGTLKHVTCKATAAYIDKQRWKEIPDWQESYELPEGIAFDTGVRRISRAGYIKRGYQMKAFTTQLSL